MNRRLASISASAAVRFTMPCLLACAPVLTGAAEQEQLLGEVIVTAQKREQSRQEVPIAINVFGEDFLRESRIGDMQDLHLYTPGYVAPPTYDFIGLSSLRGIRSNDFGYGGDPAFGVFVDGVYQGRTGASISSIFDAKRVEVVKGPQATLFGRSATSGAISIINNRPEDKLEGTLELGLGARDRRRVLGTLNLPATDQLYLRGSLYANEIDGYLTNAKGGSRLKFRNEKAARLAARYAGERVDVQLTYNYEDRKGNGNDRHQGPTAAFASDLLGTQSHIFNEHDEFVANLEVTINDAYSLSSITAYRDSKWDYAEDFDSLPIALTASPFLQGQTSKLLSQELRLNAAYDSGLSWFVGASVFRDDVTGFIDEQVDQGFAFTGQLARFSNQPFFERGEYDGQSKGWSIYGDVSFPLTERLEATLGGRYSYDDKSLQVFLKNPATDPRNTTATFPCACYLWGLYTSVPVASHDTWNDTSARASLTYTLTPDVRVFLTFSQGFKPGGIDSFGFNTDDPTFRRFIGRDGVPAGARPKVYGPEQVDNYELGIKSQWLDRRLLFNLSAYRFDYDGLQVAVNTSGAAFGIENVGKVRGEGLELETSFRPGANWELAANAGITNTQVLSLRPGVTSLRVGDRLLYNPKLTGAAFVTYRHPLSFGGEGYVRTEYSYIDDMMGSNRLALSAYGLANVRVGYNSPANKWSMAAYVANLTDKVYFTNGTGKRAFTSVVDLYSGLGEPRTAGVDFKYNF